VRLFRGRRKYILLGGVGRVSERGLFFGRLRDSSLRVCSVCPRGEKSDRNYVIAEVYALERCRGHPHIVQVLDAYLESDFVPGGLLRTTAVLVMKRFGIGLHELLRQTIQGKPGDLGGFGPSVIRGMASGLCGAVSFVHSLDLLHGDIKPPNVLGKWEGPAVTVQLADFGACVSDIVRKKILTLCSGSHTGFSRSSFCPPLPSSPSAYDASAPRAPLCAGFWHGFFC